MRGVVGVRGGGTNDLLGEEGEMAGPDAKRAAHVFSKRGCTAATTRAKATSKGKRGLFGPTTMVDVASDTVIQRSRSEKSTKSRLYLFACA